MYKFFKKTTSTYSSGWWGGNPGGEGGGGTQRQTELTKLSIKNKNKNFLEEAPTSQQRTHKFCKYV